MATLQDVLTRVRFKARDEDGIELTDSLALSFANGILETIHQHLVNVESTLVYAQASVDLVEDQALYDLEESHNGLLRQGVWIGEHGEPLEYTTIPDLIAQGKDPDSSGVPVSYYLTPDNQLGFYQAPGSDYDGETAHVLYWKQLTQLSDVEDELPWLGIWDRVIENWLLADFLERRESDNSRILTMLDQFWAKAMNQVYERGVRHWRGDRPMFTAEGV